MTTKKRKSLAKRDRRAVPVVEKGVIIPPFYMKQLENFARPNNGRKNIYPYKEMEVGDSFLIPSTMSDKNAKMSANTASYRYHKRFVVTRDNEHRLRCWRLELEKKNEQGKTSESPQTDTG